MALKPRAEVRCVIAEALLYGRCLKSAAGARATPSPKLDAVRSPEVRARSPEIGSTLHRVRIRVRVRVRVRVGVRVRVRVGVRVRVRRVGVRVRQVRADHRRRAQTRGDERR